MGEAATGDDIELQQQQSQDDTLPGGGEAGELQDGDPDDTITGSDDEGDEVVVQIGAEEPPASEEVGAAPAWVKELRVEQKRLKRENAELKAKLTGQPGQVQAPKLPDKPTLAEHDYDEEKYQAAMDGWYATKREVEAHDARQQSLVEERQKSVKAIHDNYATSKTQLRVKDLQEAEDEVVEVLDQVQQSIVIAGAANPAAMVYALGKNPAKLRELASIKDPVKFAVAVGKLETEVKVTKRTSTKPEPEKTVRGNTSAPASTAALDRLRAEADKTGDRTKVAAYLRQQSAGK